MEFHPEKCEVISGRKKKQPTLHPYYIHGHRLKHVDHVKYMGVHITSDLRWDKHVDIICNKANSALGFIRRNVNIGNSKVKTLAYKCYVRPVLGYSSTVWDPYTVSPTRKLESVQRRAARYTLCRYRRTSSVDAMLTQLEWEPLAARRRTARLVTFYKIHNGLVAIPMPLLLNLHHLPTRTGNSQAYHIPLSSRDYHLHSLYPQTVRDWNILPEAVVMATSSETFKNSIYQ